MNPSLLQLYRADPGAVRLIAERRARAARFEMLRAFFARLSQKRRSSWASQRFYTA
jgi:hypothetical protein